MDLKRAETRELHRRNVAQTIASACPNALVIAGLGSTAWDVTAAGDRDLNFPLWGAMGGAVPMGLGLALAQPTRKVLVITGDGEMLMGVGSLATVALEAPPNLSICVFDNERYGETGMQATHTAATTDLEKMAEGAGIPETDTICTEGDLIDVLPRLACIGDGPSFHVFKVCVEHLDFVLPPKDGVILKERFRAALPGTETVIQEQ